MGVATERIVARFDVTKILLEMTQGVEQVHPTEMIPVITQADDGNRRIEAMRWGLVPRWSKEISGKPLINARAETLAEKNTFRHLLHGKRCLIPADGFYEWSDRRNEVGKQDMYRFQIGDGEIFAFAGLYDDWRGPASNGALRSACLVTCEPNRLVAPVHDRMPAILRPELERDWLSPDYDLAALNALLQPYPEDRMHAELCVTTSKPIKSKPRETDNEAKSLFD